MSVQGEAHGPPPLVSRLLHSLKRRLSLGRSPRDEPHNPIHEPSSTNIHRPRNRLRSHRRPPQPQPQPQPTPSAPTPKAASTSNGHVKAGNQTRLRSFSHTLSHTLSTRARPGSIFTPSWKRPRSPVHPFTIHLPDDVLRTIFEQAAEDLDTACSLVLVASHVRGWVDPILYSRVRLEGPDSIRLFARTIQDSVNHEPSNDKTPKLAPTRIQKPPEFFGCVRTLALLPQRERILLFYREAVRDANLILSLCYGVLDLEANGDFLRRTDVSEGTLEPPNATNGDTESIAGSTDQTTAAASPNPIATAAALAPQGYEQRALMRPTHLTLVPPTLNVNFRLPILSNVTHIHYSSSLPRNLNFLGTLLALTHLAFDFQLGLATVRADGLLQLVRTALEWGRVPSPQEDPGPAANDVAQEIASAPTEHDEDELHTPVPPLAPRLTMVVVRVLLRPLTQDSDRAGEAWRKLAHLAQTESRLVYFESQGLYREDVWETALKRLCARERRSTSWFRDSIS